MSAPLPKDSLAEAEVHHHEYVTHHASPFACCRAHQAADHVPALVAEVRRLQARVEELERATPAEAALCSCWIKEHGSPGRWSESVRREYANVIADLRLEVAR